MGCLALAGRHSVRRQSRPAAHEVFAARLPGEAVDAIGVAAQHDGPRAFGALAAEIPEHDFIARARGEIAAVVAPPHEFELAVITAHL